MDLALNNLQTLICHKTQPTNQHTYIYLYINMHAHILQYIYIYIYIYTHTYTYTRVCDDLNLKILMSRNTREKLNILCAFDRKNLTY